jgi:prephenate dehydrogenase
MPERLAILGTGLIGGSLALAFKERTNLEVIGFDRNAETLLLAERIGAIDQGTTDLREAVQEADWIVLALPVRSILDMMERLAELPLKKECVVSDVGSTKAEIMQKAQLLKQKGITFIGGHPMAGSHQSGILAARPHLFENAWYVLTPDPETPRAVVDRWSNLIIRATGAEPVWMDPVRHDRIVGAISHLPHIIAAGLLNQICDYQEENDWYLRLAAGGFRDLTRIGASDPTMWRDILLSNRRELLPLIDDWIERMTLFREAVAEEDADKLYALFSRSRAFRNQLPDRASGMLKRLYECALDLPDKPGAIGKVATLLGENGINISQIRVRRNREDVPGIVEIAFGSEEEWRKAVNVLSAAGYAVIAEDQTREGIPV